jgi:hypothetical protein
VGWRIGGQVLETRTGLTPAQKLVLLGLSERADKQGRDAYPSVATLAAYAECSERAVIMALKQLVTDGWIHVQRRATHRDPTVYALNLPKLTAAESAVRSHRGRGATSAPLTKSPSEPPDPQRDATTTPQRGEESAPLTGEPVAPPDPARGELFDVRGVHFSAGRGELVAPNPIREPIREPIQRERGADAPPSPEDLVACWHAERHPGPRVHGDTLAPARRRRFGRALADVPDLDVWRAVIRWLNTQAWANAPGRGEYPRYRATLDLLAQPGKLGELLDQARADGVPRADDGAATTPAAATWAPIAQALQASGALTKRAWFEWFGEARPVSLRPDAVVVTVPAEHYVAWIAKHYAAALRDAAATAIRPGYAVVIVTADQADQIRRSA